MDIIILGCAEKSDNIRNESEKLIYKIIEQINNNEEIKQDDIKTFYKNIKSLSDIINQLKPNNIIPNDEFRKERIDLIEICENSKNTYIQYIIRLSYISFKSKLKLQKDFRYLFTDIQNSSFYKDIKNDENVKIIEEAVKIYDIIKEINDTNYSKGYKKLEEIKYKIFDDNLREVIEDNIIICKKGMLKNEIEELKKIMEQQDFENVINIIEKLLKDFDDDADLWEELLDIKKDYLYVLEELISKKIKEGNKKIDEFKKYKDFINKYEYDFDNSDEFYEKLEQLKSQLNDKKKEKEENKPKNLNEKRKRIKSNKNQIEDYLVEIQKYVPKKEFSEFKKCKKYIYEQIQNYEDEEKIHFSNSRKWISHINSYKKELNDLNNIGRIYAYFNSINKQYTSFDIHTIQLISLLILSKKKLKNMKGVFCKINTGEGKSTIIQFFAAYKVILGHKVDIVSSSPVLAERDATEKNKQKFFKELNIKVGFVSDKNKISSYKYDIVYGDTNQFSADILLQEYEFQTTRNQRGFDVVIIDEVDNMCIDNLATKTQLTKRFSGYQSFYTFYYIIVYVFNFIAFDMKLTNNKYDLEKKRPLIKKAILHKLKGNYSPYKEFENEKDVMEEVETYLSNEKQLIEAIKANDEKLIKSLTEEKDKEEEKKMGKKIQKILTEEGKILEVEGKNIIGILYPKCMKEEIETHIEKWVDSVITSFSMLENINFRINQPKKNGYQKIVPVDFSNTGVSQNNMVWNEALHQILQIINDVEVFPENVNTNFLLIITFFQKYKELYGLTGTIGSKTNQETLQKLYGVELFFIPPNLKSQLIKRSELFFTSTDNWENKIISEIKEIFKENRSALLICSSIKMAENFYVKIKKSGIQKIKKYFTEENKKVIEEILEPKNVIIATNLAGRGTDIKISDDLEKAGGLHVIVSFIPLNQRIEDQNYGRAGRKGQKGSYSLIFRYDLDKYNPLLTVELIKKIGRQMKEKQLNIFIKMKKNFLKKRKNYLMIIVNIERKN